MLVQTASDTHIYQYGFDFAVKYKDKPSFGLFWSNSFSHEDLSMASAMDGRVKNYLEQLEFLGILESSIVIFLSDHGTRWGPIRELVIGWYEERLPFLYISLPEKFKKAHPEIVKNLKTNRDRLSSPYDLHVTLKHILQLSGGYNDELSAVSCPDCQSLFMELPNDRVCSDAGIDKYWCTCVELNEKDKSTSIVLSAAKFALQQLNDDLSSHPQCAQLELKSVISARGPSSNSSVDYLITFDVLPSQALLEAKLRCEDDCETFVLVGPIARINRYGIQSWCLSDSKLRSYCYCE